MKDYLSMNIDELKSEYEIVKERYNKLKQLDLKLDMSRGKPGKEQLEISVNMLDILDSNSQLITEEGVDCRNYGLLDGISEIKEIFSGMMEVPSDNIMVGGNSSLNMMFDTISCFMIKGVGGCKPWIKQDKIKFLCPVPGYDRHFAITEYFGFEMINIPMLATGPDMDIIEKLVAEDEAIKGIWCVPKYSNPQGITYSDETVRRLANLHPKAKDFRIFWDNAYCVHDLTEEGTKLLNIFDECKKAENEDLPIIFSSTSKVTFPGSGVAAMAASDNNMKVIMEKYKYQTIGYDKINMLRHVRYFKDYNGILEHMKRHRDILKPKFDVVTDTLDREIRDRNLAKWEKPDGGYFVSVDVHNGCATRTVELCAQAGVKLTGAGAAFPYGKDPDDSNIRIAPSYPSVHELEKAMEVFCISLRLAVLEKELNI